MNVKKSLIELMYRWQYQTQRIRGGWRFRNIVAPVGGWPILVGISFPKSGTNLLRQVLAALVDVAPFADRSFDVFTVFDNQSGQQRTDQDALRFLGKFRPGDVAQVHFFAWPAVVQEMAKPRYIPYFIYRDPRDVVVSHMFYVTKMATEHVHHRYYVEVLKSDEERLSVSIAGRPDAGVDFPHIGKRFEPYLGWLDQPAVLPLRFEDFIQERRATLMKVLEHFQKSIQLDIPQQEMLDILERSIDPKRSPTFRGGRVGDWRNHFTDEHKTLFKSLAGDTLIRLGYETSHNW